MADNKTPAGVAFKVATREVTYSGETADIQAIALATVAGSDDAKTATDVDSSNPLPVAPEANVIDANNSSAVALTNAAPTFTGTATDALGYSGISVWYNSDLKSKVHVQWSADNTNFDTLGFYDLHERARNIHYSVPVRARYFRVVVTKTESGTATHTEIQTILRKHHAPTDVKIEGYVQEFEADQGVHTRPVVIGGKDASNLVSGLTMNGTWAQVEIEQGAVAHDGAATGGSERYPLLMGGYASQAAPSNVSADGDAVRAWHLRNGAQAVVLTAAGALIGGDATNGLDVDVNRTPTQGTEDAAAAANPVGEQLIVRRRDALAAETDADGDNVALNATNKGELYVKHADAVAITDSEKIADNAAFTDGTTKVQPVGYIYDETAGTALTENDIGAARMTVNRAQVATIEDPTTRGRYATVTASNALKVDNSANTQPVAGTVAHDAADSGNPQKIGGKASTKLADDTLVADLDRVDAAFDLDGAQVTRVGVPLGDIISERISNTNGTSTAFSNFTAVASTRNYVSSIMVFNDSTTNCFVDIRDGTAGSVLWTIPCPAKGGASMSFPVPLRQPTVNTALAYDVSAAITTVYISLVGFQSKA